MSNDVFFISHGESNAEINWEKVKKLLPWTKRVDGVSEISDAHQACANQTKGSHFWTIDADNDIIEDAIVEYMFNFDFEFVWHEKCVHIFHALNAVNGLQYGWGGIKLWPVENFNEVKRNYIDFTTSFSDIVVHPQLLSVTRFNTDSISAWRSAFRESAKLTKIAPTNLEARERLNVWLTQVYEVPFAREVLYGALSGNRWATKNDDLSSINDWDWLAEQYEVLFN